MNRMGVSLLITLREGLEISLVLAVIVAYLVKTNRTEVLPSVWMGAGMAVVVSLIGGLLFDSAVGDFEGRWEQAVEGTLALLTVAVLTFMVFWMGQNAGDLSGELQSKVDTALVRSPGALGAMAFIAVAREGFETALFLIGAQTDDSSGASVLLGGLIGLGLAMLIGLSFYQGSHSIDLGLFFRLTGILLILFAAGLFAKALHEFRELFGVEWSLAAKQVWQVGSGPLAEGSTLHDFLKGLFGWSPNPERIRVAAYFAYLLPATTLFLRSSTAKAKPTSKPEDSSTEVGERVG